jgi:hypothetical protein
MSNVVKNIENMITDFWVNFFKTLLWFLDKNYQSLCVSIIHYTIFIIGIYMFFFVYRPGSIYRCLFFIFFSLSTIAYFVFNSCILTSIELKLSSEKNIVQNFIGRYFGHGIEGNFSSKIVLITGTLITGSTLLKDYFSETNKDILDETIPKE